MALYPIHQTYGQLCGAVLYSSGKTNIIRNISIPFQILGLILVAFLTRYYLLEDRNSWHDEWHSIYVSDPNISNEETLSRYYGDKGNSFLTEYYPSLYLFILKFFF